MREVLCQQCQVTYPSWWQNCGVSGCLRQARPKQAPQPSIEEIHAQEQALREQFAADRYRAVAEVMRACQEGLEKSGVQVMCETARQQRSAALYAKGAQVHVDLEDARKWRRVQVQSVRQERRLAVHEKEQSGRREGQQGGDGKRGRR